LKNRKSKNIYVNRVGDIYSSYNHEISKYSPAIWCCVVIVIQLCTNVLRSSFWKRIVFN